MANLENDCIDRIFRGLFVYSVGFYEMFPKRIPKTHKPLFLNIDKTKKLKKLTS